MPHNKTMVPAAESFKQTVSALIDSLLFLQDEALRVNLRLTASVIALAAEVTRGYLPGHQTSPHFRFRGDDS